MMELTCALLFFLVGFVSATPHGYGVKGGAAARADSSASAGAFGGLGDIPVAVPLGASYSGSFSKSSSSSASSSSASSSSSSSSFSFGGSAAGASGFGLNGGTHGNVGCTSGNCQTPRTDENSASLGAYGNLGSAGCTSGSCHSSGSNGIPAPLGVHSNAGSIKCSSGNCQTPGSNGIPTSLSEHGNGGPAGCTSGNCHIYKSDGLPAPVGAHGNSESIGCSSGNCQTPGTAEIPTSFGAHGNVGSAGCTSGNCHTSGSNGITAPYGTHGTVYCSSGICQIPGSNKINAPLSSSQQGYNAVAATGAGAKSETECTGLNCGDDTDDASNCKSEQCKQKSEAGTLPTYSNTNKCTSGECGSSQNNGYPTEYGSNDIRAVSDATKSTYSSIDQSSNFDKATAGYGVASSDCSHGNCGSSAPFNSKPNYGHDSSHGYQGSSASDSHHSSSSDSGITSGYHKPALHLETPKLDSKCTSASCKSESIKPGYETSPSSYNVPIHGSYDNGQPKSDCDGVKCKNQPKGTYSSSQTNSLSSNYLNPQQSSGNIATKVPSSIDNPISINCVGSNCRQIQSGKTTGAPSHTAEPGNIHYGGPTPECKTQNCSPYPINQGSIVAPNVPSGHISDTPHHGKTPSNDKLPAYTGGFGGPAGLFKPNEFNVAGTSGPASSSVPHSGPSFGSTSPGCNSPSCLGLPSLSGAHAQAETSDSFKPNGDINVSKEILPPYTSGFGGPAGMLKPNEFEIHSTSTNIPNHAHPATSSQNAQPTAGCTSPNCGAYFTPAVSVASSQTTSFGTTKPSSSEKLPAYSGGFGGSAGLFKPNEYSSTSPTSASHTSNIPTSGSSGDCKTSNCYPSNIGPSATAHSESTSFGVNKPNTSPHVSSVTSPTYSSYGKPSGITKPNEVSGASLPSSPGSSYSTGCNTGNCGSNLSSGAAADANAQSGAYDITKPNIEKNPATKFPQYTGSFGVPSGTLKPHENTHNSPATVNTPTICKTSDCGNSPTATAIVGANAQSGSFANSKDKLPVYTGGFGGPAGLFKPNEYTAPAVKPTLNVNRPLAPTGVPNPTACTSGNCNPQGPLAHTASTHPSHISASHGQNHAAAGAHATANADANALLYTGGFGGPPGVLKPYDDGKIKPHANDAHSHGLHIGAQYSSPSANTNLPHGSNLAATSSPSANVGQTGSNGNIGVQAGSIAGSAAYSGATSGATTGYNTHGSHYNQAGGIKGGSSASPCGGGCGGASAGGYNGGYNFDFNGGHGGSLGSAAATAKSLAGANAFGTGGSFASSSASAHASAGAYTKGGYGRR